MANVQERTKKKEERGLTEPKILFCAGLRREKKRKRGKEERRKSKTKKRKT